MAVGIQVGKGVGMVPVKTNAELTAEEIESAELERNSEEPKVPIIDDLAAHFRAEWALARDAKQPIEAEMLASLRQREGKYDDAKLKAIREMGGSEIKMMLTDVKCRAAEAWIHDVLLGSGERPFSTTPTPLPEIPPEVMADIEREAYTQLEQMNQMIPDPHMVRERVNEFVDELRKRAKDFAARAAARMEDRIDDIYSEGDFYECLEDVITDFVTLKAGILKGPVIRSRKMLQWAQDNDPMRPHGMKPVLTDRAIRTFYAVSPFDLYLSPDARNVQEGTVIERHRLSPESLYALIGMPGFNEQEIRAVLQECDGGGLNDWLWGDAERSKLEGRPLEQQHGSRNLDVLECWGSVKGEWLKRWGMEGLEDEERWYAANCWMIGNHVIRAVLNDDPLGQRPYHMDAYVRVRNSPWGRGVPEIMSDLQNMCDACARAIANNMGIASGPQAEINVDQLPEGESITKMYPWKIWQTTSSKTGGTGGAVHFFQPNSNADVLMAVFQFFSELADEYTGIPRYQYGDPNVGGAGRTASGLSMLMNAASKTMKGVIKNIDRMIINCTRLTHRNLMLYDDEMENKGDVNIIAKASQALLHRESQAMRLAETLTITNNPIDFQLMGPKGRLELLRGSLRGLDAVDVDKVLPSNDEMLLQAMSAQLPPPQGEEAPEEQPQQAE